MPDLIHHNFIALNAKSNAVVACSYPIPTSQITGESLRSAHVGPVLQAMKHLAHAPLDDTWEAIQFIESFGRRANNHASSLFQNAMNLSIVTQKETARH